VLLSVNRFLVIGHPQSGVVYFGDVCVRIFVYVHVRCL